MPHSNGKIFVQGDYGVSTDDVASVLGVASSDVGTLCTSNKINMWSKYKPVKRADINPYSDSNWWKGDYPKTSPCGIEPKSWDFTNESLQALATDDSGYFSSDGKNGWKYYPPEDDDFKRLADFNGYFHTARPPYKTMVVTQYDNWGNKYQITFQGDIHSFESQDEITIKDLFGVEYFHGVYAYRNVTENGNVIIRQTDEKIGAEKDRYIHTYPNLQYKLWAFFYANNNAERGDIPINLYTCCGIPTKTFTATAKLELWGAAWQARAGADSLCVNLYIINTSNEDITIKHCYVMSKKNANYDFNLNNLDGEQFFLEDESITISKNGGRADLFVTDLVTGIFPNMSINNIHLMVYLDNGNKKTEITIRKSAENLTPEEFQNNVIEES